MTPKRVKRPKQLEEEQVQAVTVREMDETIDIDGVLYRVVMRRNDGNKYASCSDVYGAMYDDFGTLFWVEIEDENQNEIIRVLENLLIAHLGYDIVLEKV